MVPRGPALRFSEVAFRKVAEILTDPWSSQSLTPRISNFVTRIALLLTCALAFLEQEQAWRAGTERKPALARGLRAAINRRRSVFELSIVE